MATRPRLVFFPFPAQGHITPAFQLAWLLHRRHGFDVTFVHTEHNRRRLLRVRGLGALAGGPGFRLVAVPDGLPPSDEDDAPQDMAALHASLQSAAPRALRDLLLSSDLAAPAHVVVSDMDHVLRAAAEMGLPCVTFWITSASSFMAFQQCRQLVARGLVPLKDDEQLRNGYLDTVIDWVPPGLPKAMRLRDFPSFIRTTDPADPVLAMVLRSMECHRTVPSAVIFHTLEELEGPVLRAMSDLLTPPVYAVGPLPPLLKEQEEEEKEGNTLLGLMGSSNLSREDRACLDWLDGQLPNSVVFVSFGSLVTPSKQCLAEVAWGLAASGYAFLWVIRSDHRGDELLPPGFLAETEGRGRVTGWCPQEAVLRHGAVGAFLTHCGWNSMMESLCAGVPMLCLPFTGDQQTNSRVACTEWCVGVEVGEDAARGEVEAAVRRVMGEEDRRRAAMEWKEKVARATGPAGSSWAALDRVVNEVLTPLLLSHSHRVEPPLKSYPVHLAARRNASHFSFEKELVSYHRLWI